MKAVEYAFVSGTGYVPPFLPVEPEDLAGGLEKSFRFEEPYMDLIVRYDTGQTCVFKRKTQ